MSVAASDSIARSASTLRISGWSTRRLPNAERCARVPGRLRDARAACPAAAPITQSRRVWLTISMIVGTPRPGSPTIRAQRAVELDLGGRVGAVAELVLEALEVEAALRSPSGSTRGRAKQETPSLGLGEHEEQVAHRRRAEPLVAGERVPRRRRRPRRAWCWRARRSRPASRSSPCRTARSACPARERGVVRRGGQARLPLGGDVGLHAQRGHRREGHRDRAAEAGLGLRGADVARRARDVGAGAVGRARAARAARARRRAP